MHHLEDGTQEANHNHDNHNHSMMNMQMFFHFGSEETVLFNFWHTKSAFGWLFLFSIMNILFIWSTDFRNFCLLHYYNPGMFLYGIYPLVSNLPKKATFKWGQRIRTNKWPIQQVNFSLETFPSLIHIHQIQNEVRNILRCQHACHPTYAQLYAHACLYDIQHLALLCCDFWWSPGPCFAQPILSSIGFICHILWSCLGRAMLWIMMDDIVIVINLIFSNKFA